MLQRKDTPASYHLAVVVDDAAQGITHVTRGRDMEAATDIHVLLQMLLGLPQPVYTFHQLILGEDGRKLSKSRGSLSLRDLRQAGTRAESIRNELGVLTPTGDAVGEPLPLAGEGDQRSWWEGAGLDSVPVAAPFRRSATPSPASGRRTRPRTHAATGTDPFTTPNAASKNGATVAATAVSNGVSNPGPSNSASRTSVSCSGCCQM